MAKPKKMAVHRSGDFVEYRFRPGADRFLFSYVKTRGGKAKVAKTKEILPEVFADFDKNGKVVGVEFVGNVHEINFSMLEE